MEKVVTLTLPNDAQLAELSRVWIVDNVVGESPLGTGEMPVIAIGETENGYTFRTGSDGAKYRGGGVFAPLRVYSAADFYAKFGRLGFTTEDGPSRGAVARRSGGNKLWNGNLFVNLSGLEFNRLIIGRVDNSAGSVTFRRHAALKGGKGPFDLEPGDIVTFQRNGVTNVTSTFNAAAAQIVGIGGTYPTGFTGGETLVIQVDDDAPKTITMTSAEQLLADVIARINLVMAATIASNVGGELALSSVIRGTDGRIQVTGGTALATLGLVSTPVQNVWTFTVNAVTAGLYTLRYQVYVNGILTNFDANYTAGGGETVTQLRGFMLTNGATTGWLDLPGATGVTVAASGVAQITITGAANVKIISATVAAEPTPGDITVVETTPGQYTDQSGTGNVGNIDSVTATEAATIIDAGANLAAFLDDDGYLWVGEDGTPITGTLQATAGVYATLGFSTTISNANSATKVTIPAGTRVKDSTTGTYWCTLEDYETEVLGGGYDLKVRPWEDLDTALTSAPSGIDTVTDMPFGYWSVTNAAQVNRLSATQLNIRYKEAMERTLDANSAASAGRIIFSARSSAQIDTYLLENALASASAGTLAPRRCIVSPPVGTTIEDALASSGVGVGTNRNDRRIYAFPGVRKLVEEIASVGEAPGVGFTESGIVETTACALYAFVRAKLPAERSAGESPNANEIGPLSTYGIVGLESAYDSSQGGTSLISEDYVAFKAGGIVALNRVDDLGFWFQSDVSSVDPTIDKARAPASRGFLFDEIAYQIWRISIPFKAKLTRPTEIRALVQVLTGYLNTMQAPSQPERSRIAAYSISMESTDNQLANGLVLMKLQVQRYAHIESIVYNVNLTPQAIEVSEAA